MSQNICQWIETHADFVPEKLAVRFEGREITYRELLSQITQTAAVLKDVYGIGRGERVAYLGFNSPELLVLLFACARLGALLLPLNWRLAPLEQTYILENAVARIPVAREKKLVEPRDPNTVPEAPEPKAAPALAPLPR